MNLLSENLNKRLLVIGSIALAMFIPLVWVTDLVDERHGYYRTALQDVSSLWGQLQILKGPVLVIPFIEEHMVEEKIKDDDGEERTRIKTIHKNRNAIFLPDNLTMSLQLSEKYRYRGIYESLVYTAKIDIKGKFFKPDINKLSERIHHINWDRAYLSFGITDTKAITREAMFRWNGTEKTVEPGTGIQKILNNGIHVPLDMNDQHYPNHSFSLTLALNGSHGIRFSPFGEITEINMKSTWPHPSFSGNILPNSHDINDKGFTASWRIPHIARNYPQSWLLESTKYNLDELLAGVDLFEPVFIYSKLIRSVKYGFLFVVLTFLTFLVFELLTRACLHYVQYGMTGTALTMFYLVLLSLSEHIGFLWSYLIASIINIGLISCYTAAALRNIRASIIICTLLSSLYLALYLLLQLEDYALLTGTCMLLIIMMILMYLTRNLKPAVTKATATGSEN